MSSRYKVTITYAEPTYARHRGIEQRSYRGVFEVTAHDPDAAIRLATELFHEAQRCSGVSWAREIQQTRCRLISPTAALAT